MGRDRRVHGDPDDSLDVTVTARQDSLGVFVPFMQAYGRADAQTKLAVDHAAAAYRLHLLTPQAFQARVYGLLGIGG